MGTITSASISKTVYKVLVWHVYQVWCFFMKMHNRFDMPLHYKEQANNSCYIALAYLQLSVWLKLARVTGSVCNMMTCTAIFYETAWTVVVFLLDMHVAQEQHYVGGIFVMEEVFAKAL